MKVRTGLVKDTAGAMRKKKGLMLTILHHVNYLVKRTEEYQE
jgi:hypothetical protein